MVVSTEEQLVKIMDALLESGRVTQFKNQFIESLFNGYHDVLVNFCLPLPMVEDDTESKFVVVEVQVHYQPILALKAKNTHLL